MSFSRRLRSAFSRHFPVSDYGCFSNNVEFSGHLKQESSNFREVPVVIMSSENVLTRIDRCDSC